MSLPLASDSLTVLVVNVDDVEIALPVDVVTAVVRMVGMTELPGAPEVVAGLVDFHGDPVAVGDLRRRLGRRPRPPRLEDRLVYVSLSGQALLVWVDAVADLRDLDSAGVTSLEGPLASSPHLEGVVGTVDGLLYIHDPVRFFTDAEAAELEAALSAHAGRS